MAGFSSGIPETRRYECVGPVGCLPTRARRQRSGARHKRSGTCCARRLHDPDRAWGWWSSRPTISSRPRSTTGSFRGRCCASRRAGGGWTSTTIPTRPNSSTGTADVPVDVDGRPRRARRSFPRTPSADRVHPGPAGFRFYHTHMVAGSDLTRGTYTAARSGRSISSPAQSRRL